MSKKRSKDDEDDQNSPAPAKKRSRKGNAEEDGESRPTPGQATKNHSDDELDCSQNPGFTVQTEAEVGIVEKVILQNFMCHKYLEVNLGSNVNFIIGRNGSGKSAIMTGLIVGLGGKASTTSRGNSLKGFIKDDCHTATVIIKLRNRGTDAYMPDEYGNVITIERKLKHDGASSYSLKSTEGKVISNKREDLLNVLDQFNIQIDNPVSILNQDTSRCFLNSSDPKDKYKFFLKATQLEQMSIHYQMILEKKENIKMTLTRKREVLPEMEEQVKVLEEKYKDLAQLKEMREKVKMLKEELVWASVRDKRSELEHARKNVQREECRVPKHDEKINQCKASIEGAEQAHEEKESQIKTHVDEGRELAEKKHDCASIFKKLKLDFRIKQDSIRKKEKELSLSDKERKQLADRIDEIKQRVQRDMEAERQKTQSVIAERDQERQMIQSRLSTSIHHRNQLEMSIKASQEKAYHLRQDETEGVRKLGTIKRQLETFQESQQNKLNIFGSWVPMAVEKIQDAHQRGAFHHAPVGPLGAYLKLKDQNWNIAVEKCLGKSLLLGFCCHDLHDKEKLLGILRSCVRGAKPVIIVSKFQDKVYDVSRHRSQSQHPTVLDMLEISNPVVANTLIDQGKIESVLLIKEPKEAQNVMWNESPRGASKAFTILGDEVIGGRSLKWYSNKNPKSLFLKASVDNDIRQWQIEVQQEQDRLQRIKDNIRQQEKDVRLAQEDLQKTKKKCNVEQGQLNKLSLEIQEIKLAEEEEEALPDLSTLEEDLGQYVIKIDNLKQEISDEHQAVAAQKVVVLEQQTKDNELKGHIENLTARIEPLTDELDKIGGEIQQLKSDRKYYETKKAELVQKIEAVTIISRSLEEEFQTMHELTANYCEEIKTDRKVKSLESEITQTEKRVRNEEQNRGNAEEVTKKYHEAMKKYKEICETLRSFRKFQKRLESVVLRRARQFEKFRRYIVIRAKQYFTMTLSQRGYSGKLKIDHDRETLTIHVNVEQAKGTAAKDTRSLSGGERSFSTICFIMALWEAMESPFRVLDEFDVFMDMVNRRISMNMLLKIAKEQRNRQFILLTPQDMSNISGGDSVRIYKMKDPERGQTIIPFAPVVSLNNN